MTVTGEDGARFAENWTRIRKRVDAACESAGRDCSEVTILPVSKTFGPQRIREALALGLRRFGENRVQEISEKATALSDFPVDWVVIGHLQTNKAKEVAVLAREVQSLDSLKLAQALDRHLQQHDRMLDVLVQVKTSPEPSKFGLAADGLPHFLDALRDFPRLHVQGLMTLAIQSDSEDAVRACFRQLRQLRDASVARGHVLPRLSMGMSGDFPLAIAEGSTEVRIGSALFGERA